MSTADECLPTLTDMVLPTVRGVADLTTFAYQGHDFDDLMKRIEHHLADNPPETRELSRQYDTAIAHQLSFRRAQGLNLLDEVLERCRCFRIGGADNAMLRVLALVAPGDLMTNTPLDFLTNHVNVRLDLLYLLPGQDLPATIPDHDVAFFAVGESDSAELGRLNHLFARWPRPALNNPRFLPNLTRNALSRSLAAIPSICSPLAAAVTRRELEAYLRAGLPITGFQPETGLYPCLIRPYASHAGHGLARVTNDAELANYLRVSFASDFYLTEFEEYACPDGMYRKSRVAFIDRKPFLCHQAISRHWMVHYLNAGMSESADKRAQEAKAMADFDTGFARRHAAAFAELHQRLGFDLYSIDCAETRDGRLLVFEADTAAIIHVMDPPDLFPYKQVQMHRVFAAFETMLRRRMTQLAA